MKHFNCISTHLQNQSKFIYLFIYSLNLRKKKCSGVVADLYNEHLLTMLTWPETLTFLKEKTIRAELQRLTAYYARISFVETELSIHKKKIKKKSQT